MLKKIKNGQEYYRYFIKDFTAITKPLTNLLNKNKKFIWTQDCDESFNLIKKFPTAYPILRAPDFTRTFILTCDSSHYALGVQLGQKDDNNHEYAISYDSRQLKGSELNLSVSEKECLSVIFGCKKYRPYLAGVHFIVITDNKALN